MRWALGLTLAGIVATAAVTYSICGSLFEDARPGPVFTLLPGEVNGSYGWHGAPYRQNDVWTEGAVQYAAWVRPDRSARLGTRTLPDGPWRTVDLGGIPDNPLMLPMELDPHNVLSVAVDRDGRIHLAGNMHNDALRYARSQQPHDMKTMATASMVGVNEESVTYPRFVRRKDGRILFIYRNGVSGDGDVFVNLFDEPTRTWHRIAHLFDGGATGESPYLQRVTVGEDGAIHVMVVWRGTGNAATNNDVGYAVSRDGGRSWTRQDGLPYDLPITHPEIELALDTAPSGSGLLNQSGMDVDSHGRPHTAVLFYDEAGETEYLHVWHDGQNWRRKFVTDFGIRMDTDVSIINPTVARPQLVVDGRDRVWIIYRADVGDRIGHIMALDVKSGTEHVLAEINVGQWEPSLDSVALQEQEVLTMLVVPSAKLGDPSRRAEQGWVLQVSLSDL